MSDEGKFVWYELMTTDADAAADFYSSVVGWEHKPAENTTAGGMPYHMFNIPGYDMGVAGMMTLTGDMQAGGARPAWLGYVAVGDVDAKAKEFAANGGAVHMPGTDIPDIGRFAFVADPHGAMLYVFKPIMLDGPMPEMPKPGDVGTVGWNELYAGDAEEAMAFYGKVFGWTEDEVMDMGEMGKYWLFAHDGQQTGGMMTKTPDMPMPFWNYYFVVDRLDAAMERIKARGGSIVVEPMEVPGGAWVVQAMDPQGAFFSLTAGER